MLKREQSKKRAAQKLGRVSTLKCKEKGRPRKEWEKSGVKTMTRTGGGASLAQVLTKEGKAPLHLYKLSVTS